MKQKIALWQRPGFVIVDDEATVGAVLGKTLTWPDGRPVQPSDLGGGNADAVMAAHLKAGNPHPQYLLRSDYVPGGGGSPQVNADWDATSGVEQILNKPDNVVESIVPGMNVTVDDTDPKNPVVSASGGGGIALGTSLSTPDTSGTITPQAKATDYLKITVGANTYLVPACKYLGEGVFTSLPALIASLGPTAYWPMNEASGTTLTDSVAGETLTLSGSYTLNSTPLVTGDSRKSILFGGGYATGTAAAKWALGGGDCAGVIVGRWNATSLSTFFSVRDGGANILAIANCNRVATGDVSAENWDFNLHKANSPGTSYNTNVVHALGFNYVNATKTLSLYVDGALVKSVVCGGTRPIGSTMFVRVASNAGIQNFYGNLQDFALFSKALTSQNHLDIANIVQNGHT